MTPQLLQPRVWASAFTLSAALLVGACSSSDDDASDANDVIADPNLSTLIVPLSSQQEVPPLDVEGATGEGNLTIDTATGALSGSVSVSGTTGAPVMAHIHQGFAGTNGPVVVGLEGSNEGALWTVPADTVLDAVQLASLNAGEMYINVHTAANPGGELRGQILPADIQVIRTALSGAQENPPVTSDASATGVMTLNTASGAVFATISTVGVDDATMAHIHSGARNENGGVVLGLEQSADNVASWSTPAGSVFDAEALAAVQNDALYYNVHTPANPSGELRGQIAGSGTAADAVEFSVVIENVSNGETLPTSTGSVAVPLSPGAYVVHREARNPLLDPRDPASAALEALAEDGDPSLFPSTVGGSGVFNTPDGADAPGPLFPGDSYSFSVAARPGDALALATMFVQSNDWFYSTTDADDDSISLFDADGNPISGDVSDQLTLWESGTEQDEEPGTGPNQAPRQAGPNTGPAEGLTVGGLAGRGKSVTLNGQVIRVTITPMQ